MASSETKLSARLGNGGAAALGEFGKEPGMDNFIGFLAGTGLSRVIQTGSVPCFQGFAGRFGFNLEPEGAVTVVLEDL